MYIAESVSQFSLLFFLFFLLFVDFFLKGSTHMQDWGTSSQPGVEPVLPAVKVQSSNHWTASEVHSHSPEITTTVFQLKKKWVWTQSKTSFSLKQLNYSEMLFGKTVSCIFHLPLLFHPHAGLLYSFCSDRGLYLYYCLTDVLCMFQS